MPFSELNRDHSSIIETVKIILANNIPQSTLKILKAQMEISKISGDVGLAIDSLQLYRKDLNESIGFTHGSNYKKDIKGAGMLGPLVVLNFLDKIKAMYE